MPVSATRSSALTFDQPRATSFLSRSSMPLSSAAAAAATFIPCGRELFPPNSLINHRQDSLQNLSKSSDNRLNKGTILQQPHEHDAYSLHDSVNDRRRSSGSTRRRQHEGERIDKVSFRLPKRRSKSLMPKVSTNHQLITIAVHFRWQISW